MKTALRGVFALVLIIGLTGCSQTTDTKTTDGSKTMSPISQSNQRYTAPTAEEVATLDALAKTNNVRITTAKGVINLSLYPDDAPITVASFLKLIQAGFYDGLTFHRVEPGFVIQGGDPSGNGTGGPGYNVKAEFNSKKHETGTLAMARAMDPDSAGSQFYITLAPQPALDNQYTVFGKVVSDADFAVVQKITIGDVMQKVEIVPKGQ